MTAGLGISAPSPALSPPAPPELAALGKALWDELGPRPHSTARVIKVLRPFHWNMFKMPTSLEHVKWSSFLLWLPFIDQVAGVPMSSIDAKGPEHLAEPAPAQKIDTRRPRSVTTPA